MIPCWCGHIKIDHFPAKGRSMRKGICFACTHKFSTVSIQRHDYQMDNLTLLEELYQRSLK